MRGAPELERLIALQERLLAAVGNAETEPGDLRELGRELAAAEEEVRVVLAGGVPEGSGALLHDARRLAASLVAATRRESSRVEISLERVRGLAKEARRRASAPAAGRSCDVAG